MNLPPRQEASQLACNAMAGRLARLKRVRRFLWNRHGLIIVPRIFRKSGDPALIVPVEDLFLRWFEKRLEWGKLPPVPVWLRSYPGFGAKRRTMIVPRTPEMGEE